MLVQPQLTLQAASDLEPSRRLSLTQFLSLGKKSNAVVGETIGRSSECVLVFDSPASLLIVTDVDAPESVAVVCVVVVWLYISVRDHGVTPLDSLVGVGDVADADCRRSQVTTVGGSLDLNHLDAPGADIAAEFVLGIFIFGGGEAEL